MLEWGQPGKSFGVWLNSILRHALNFREHRAELSTSSWVIGWCSCNQTMTWLCSPSDLWVATEPFNLINTKSGVVLFLSPQILARNLNTVIRPHSHDRRDKFSYINATSVALGKQKGFIPVTESSTWATMANMTDRLNVGNTLQQILVSN